jgi:glycine/D-amino acid oxidase-like deaminating enzyme
VTTAAGGYGEGARRDFEALVIGAGVIGCSVTYHLARRGLRVCLIDRGAVASGTTRASAGGMSVQARVPGPSLELALANVRLLDDLLKELPTPFGYVQSGGLIVAEDATEYRLLRDFASRQALHVPIEFWEADELRKREPQLSPHFLGATFCPLDGYVNPMGLALALARGARALGAEIRIQTEVSNLIVDRDRVVGARTRTEPLTASAVINAAGVWSSELARLAGVAVPIIPRRGQLIVTEPLPSLLGPMVSHAGHVPFKDHGIEAPPEVEGELEKKRYIVQHQVGSPFAGRFYVGSTSEFRGFDRSVTTDGISQLAQYAVETVPALRRARLVRAWAGLRPRSQDGKFLIGESPALRGFFLATGHDSVGVLNSGMTGKLLAEWIASGVRPPLLAPFDPARHAIGAGRAGGE